MAESRLFAYYPQEEQGRPAIAGASQSGNVAMLPGTILSVEAATATFSHHIDSSIILLVEWFNGPDENSGYVIAYESKANDKFSKTRTSGTASRFNVHSPIPFVIETNKVIYGVGFRRTSDKTDVAFLALANSLAPGQNFGSASVAANWLNTNGYATTYTVPQATPPVPVNTTPPALSYGGRYEGELVNTDDGTWDNSPTSFTYQWYRDATPISGETLNEYYLVSDDVDKEITCQVTAINAIGSSSPASSNAIYIFDYDYAQVYYQYEDTDGAKSILQNQFMIAIKAAGVWDKLDVLCVFRGSGASSALVDWKRLTLIQNRFCSFGTTQGFTGNPSINAYINTYFNLSSGSLYRRNNASRYFFPFVFSGTGPMDGTFTSADNTMSPVNSNKHFINQMDTLSSDFEYTTTVEPKSIHRTSATDVTLFNGTTSASRTGASQGTTGNLFILRNNTDYADHTVAAYAAGASMVAENTAFLAAWNTYITAL